MAGNKILSEEMQAELQRWLDERGYSPKERERLIRVTERQREIHRLLSDRALAFPRESFERYDELMAQTMFAMSHLDWMQDGVGQKVEIVRVATAGRELQAFISKLGKVS